MPNVQVRQIGDDYVVDLGATWFRVRTDGSVTKKYAVRRHGQMIGDVETKPATTLEGDFAKEQVEKHLAEAANA